MVENTLEMCLPERSRSNDRSEPIQVILEEGRLSLASISLKSCIFQEDVSEGPSSRHRLEKVMSAMAHHNLMLNPKRPVWLFPQNFASFGACPAWWLESLLTEDVLWFMYGAVWFGVTRRSGRFTGSNEIENKFKQCLRLWLDCHRKSAICLRRRWGGAIIRDASVMRSCLICRDLDCRNSPIDSYGIFSASWPRARCDAKISRSGIEVFKARKCPRSDIHQILRQVSSFCQTHRESIRRKSVIVERRTHGIDASYLWRNLRICARRCVKSTRQRLRWVIEHNEN
jgi:hypothetical protein